MKKKKYNSTAELDIRDLHGHPPPPKTEVGDKETLVNFKMNLVDHPSHYNYGKYETIDVIEDWGLDFNCGNAVKYISRHMHKGSPVRDIEKAIWYLRRRLESLRGREK